MSHRVAGVLAAAVALVATGCGSTGLVDATADRSNGKEQFTAKCGSCHTLADAGTQGRIGPNLDDAFSQSRADGYDESTIAAIVRGQIAYPVEEPVTGVPGMPADLVTGDDADDVAAYVAAVAGTGATAQPAPPSPPPSGSGTTTGEGSAGGGTEEGKQVFASAGCGGCHVLADAGATGNVGPNLDETRPGQELVVDRVTNGQGAMPAFRDQLSPEQIEAVAEYVSSVAGG